MAILSLNSETERIIIFLVTGLSNLTIIPTLLSGFQTQSHFHQFVGWFTMLISICYHCCEALPSQRFYLHEGNWHRLDNVGAITSFTLLMIYLMDIGHYPKLRAFLELSQFGITLLIQERAPWHLPNTVVPIAFWFAVCVLRHLFMYFVHGNTPNFNWRNFRIGWGILLVAFWCFAKGLDDDHDYLRLYHSSWHLLATLAAYWLWRIVESENTEKATKTN